MRCWASVILSSNSKMSFFCTPSMYSVSSISCSVLEGVVRALSAMDSYSLRSLCGCGLGVVGDRKGERKDKHFWVNEGCRLPLKERQLTLCWGSGCPDTSSARAGCTARWLSWPAPCSVRPLAVQTVPSGPPMTQNGECSLISGPIIRQRPMVKPCRRHTEAPWPGFHRTTPSSRTQERNALLTRTLSPFHLPMLEREGQCDSTRKFYSDCSSTLPFCWWGQHICRRTECAVLEPPWLETRTFSLSPWPSQAHPDQPLGAGLAERSKHSAMGNKEATSHTIERFKAIMYFCLSYCL